MLQMNVYHSIKEALEERPAQKKAKNKKNVSNLAHVVQNKKNATLIFQKLKLDSVADLFGDINYNIQSLGKLFY